MSPITFCLQNLGFMTITKGNSAKYKNCILDLLPPFLSLPMNIRLIFLKHTLPYHHSTTPQAFKTPIIICHLIFFSKLRQLLLGKILCESKVYRDQFNNLIKVKNNQFQYKTCINGFVWKLRISFKMYLYLFF